MAGECRSETAAREAVKNSASRRKRLLHSSANPASDVCGSSGWRRVNVTRKSLDANLATNVCFCRKPLQPDQIDLWSTGSVRNQYQLRDCSECQKRICHPHSVGPDRSRSES